ncbi:MAG: B12-binding domain-containing radical SAM protein [Candidatus Heimdallarchaeota archaeon]
MKVLLLVPPSENGVTTKYQLAFLDFTAPPLGLAYMAGVLEEHGYTGHTNVRILDSHALNYTPNDYRRYLKRFHPDILGIQTLTPNFGAAMTGAQIAREEGVPHIILGGYHPSALPDECLKQSNGNITAVIRGEAEYTFLEFVQCVEEGMEWRNIKGISYIGRNGEKPRKKEIIHNPPAPVIKDLDSLPLPSRHLLPMEKYKIFGSAFPATSVITSRGCPYHCDFCSVSAFHEARYRARSPEKIADELRYLREVMDIKAAAFVDDLFFLSKKRVKNLTQELSKVKDIYWGATTRADSGKYELLNLMRKAGCRLVFVGVESGSQTILDKIHKKTTINQIERYFDNTKKARMDSLASVSFGFPGETRSSIINTVEWIIQRLDPSLALFTLATPYPGTDFYQQMLKQGRIKEHDYSKYNLFHPITEITGLDRQELKALTKWAYKRFYLRPRKILQNTKREFRYSLESYGLKQFLQNTQVFAKGIVNMKILTSM